MASVTSLSNDKRRLLEQMLQEKGLRALATSAIPRRDPALAAPASLLQEGLWLLDQIEPGSATMNVPGAIRLTGPLSADALEWALTEIVRRHESLRTTFVHDGNILQQIVTPAHARPLETVELSDLPPDERESEAIRLAVDDARTPFDLAVGPLFRTRLLRINECEHILLLNMHHIVTDGWSMGVLTRELSAMYSNRVGRPTQPIVPLPLQFGDYAVWQRKRLAGATLEKEIDYWRGKLAPPWTDLALPTDFDRPSAQGSRGAHQNLALSESLSAQIRQLATRLGATSFEVLLTGYKSLLSIYTRQTDIIVGAPVANRIRSELHDLIGYFVNVLPLRTDLAGNPTFETLVDRVRSTTREAHTHQEVPFGKLVERLKPPRSPGRNPIYQTEFTLLEPDETPAVYGYGFGSPVRQTMNMADIALTPVEVESGVSKFDVTLLLWNMPRAFAGTIEYNRDLFRPETITRLSEDFTRLLRVAVMQPESRLDDIATAVAADAVSSRLSTPKKSPRSVSCRSASSARRLCPIEMTPLPNKLLESDAATAGR